VTKQWVTHVPTSADVKHAAPPRVPQYVERMEESEYYQIAFDIDRGNGTKLKDLIIERDTLKREVQSLRNNIVAWQATLKEAINIQ
jgi:hypothetical protein